MRTIILCKGDIAMFFSEIYKTVEELKVYITDFNFSILGERQIENCIQFYLETDELESIYLNIYNGKNGIVFVSSNKSSDIYKDILPFIISFKERNTSKLEKYIGTDESGKGDYFGPLVVAAFYTNNQINNDLREIGVDDSKKLSDNKIVECYQYIQGKYCDNIDTYILYPEKYNELYSNYKLAGKSLNHLLANAHTRAMEKLVIKQNEIKNIVNK